MPHAIVGTRGFVEKRTAWVQSVILSLSIPIAIVFLQFTARQIESIWHVDPVLHYCLSVSAICGGEWIVMAGFMLWWKPNRGRMAEIGFAGYGTVLAWIVALGITLISVLNGVGLLRRFDIPISALWSLSGFHIYAALLMGGTAAFCEETIFRGFLMTQYAGAGCGRAMQVIIPGLFFGIAHLAILEQGLAIGLGTILPTTMMGMVWGISYLAGRRSLIPPLVAHFLNDATVLPWILYFSITHSGHL